MSGISTPTHGRVAPDVDVDVVADFTAAAEAWPDRPAVVHNGRAVTYGDFAERVGATALRYWQRRISPRGPSGLIGVLVSHTPATPEHLFAILMAGAAYCPIDAALPPARKEVLAEVLGLDRSIAVTGEPPGAGGLHVECVEPAVPGDAADHPRMDWRADDPAYVLCTSGSTGAPKPVVVSRRALSVTVAALRDLFALTPRDRVLQFAALGWDTCLEEMLPALTSGATLVFDDAARCGSFPPLLRMVAEQGITVLDLPTAFWHELVLFLHEEDAALPACVRLVVIGGERVDPTRLRQWRGLDVGDVTLLNTYGCTETTMVTHAVQLSGPGTEEAVLADDAEAPIGRSLPHVHDHVTDDDRLMVAGPALATGYLGMPEVTESAFAVADHGSGPARWFDTGDVVGRGAGGLLYARGRADEQLKVLGVRVHPAEVEAQLITHPSVASAVVVGERRRDRTTLTAYVVAAAATTPKELKRYLRERLPGQFVPSRLEIVAGLSYTASGKVDRAATHRAANTRNEGAGE